MEWKNFPGGNLKPLFLNFFPLAKRARFFYPQSRGAPPEIIGFESWTPDISKKLKNNRPKKPGFFLKKGENSRVQTRGFFKIGGFF